MLPSLERIKKKGVTPLQDTDMVEEMDDQQYAEYRQGLFKRNQAFSKGKFNLTTFKTDKEEEDYRKWAEDKKIPINHEDPYPDYDMRGFYKALKSGDKKATSAINPSDGQIHYPDHWKTPYHETFSAQSQWANKKTAPDWVGDDKKGWKLQDKAGNVYKDESIPQQGK